MSNIFTSIPQMRAEEIRDVVDFTPENEKLRQGLIALERGELDFESAQSELRSLHKYWKENANQAAKNYSSNYIGGKWSFNEHGLLSLTSPLRILFFSGSFKAHELSEEEFAYAISLITANHLSWSAKDQNIVWLQSFFQYMYHFAHALLDNTSQVDGFKAPLVLEAVD